MVFLLFYLFCGVFILCSFLRLFYIMLFSVIYSYVCMWFFHREQSFSFFIRVESTPVFNFVIKAKMRNYQFVQAIDVSFIREWVRTFIWRIQLCLYGVIYISVTIHRIIPTIRIFVFTYCRANSRPPWTVTLMNIFCTYSSNIHIMHVDDWKLLARTQLAVSSGVNVLVLS